VISQKEQPIRGTGLLAGEERRRSQRVIIRVPITLAMTEKGKTVQISAHTIAARLSASDWLECRVIWKHPAHGSSGKPGTKSCIQQK
jgi:hypothetical protein